MKYDTEKLGYQGQKQVNFDLGNVKNKINKLGISRMNGKNIEMLNILYIQLFIYAI